MASGGLTAEASDPAYVSAMTELHPHPTALFPSSASAGGGLPSTSDPPLLDSLSVLTSGGGHPGMGGARDNSATMSLSHVLSGLQEEGTLAEVLQEQPNLAHGLNTIALGEVSSDPESLRFQFQPGDDSMLQNLQMAAATPTTATASSSKRKEKAVYREQDRFLPLHNVARTMRNAIPLNGKVSKDAKECMQECVSEFISFITSEASDKCIAERRKTITGDDILFAMATLGFDNYIEPLRLYLQKWREFTRTEKIAAAAAQHTTTNSYVGTPPPNSHVPVVLSRPGNLTQQPQPPRDPPSLQQVDVTSFTNTQSHQ